MLPTCHAKSKKIVNFGAPACIFYIFYSFWEESKKHDFSMSLWVVPWGAQGHPLTDLSVHPGFPGFPRVPTGSQPGPNGYPGKVRSRCSEGRVVIPTLALQTGEDSNTLDRQEGSADDTI